MPRVTGPEAIRPPARLTNGEFRNRPRGRRLSFSRQRRANERPMHGPLIVFAILAVAFVPVLAIRHAIVFRCEIRLHFGIVVVFVELARGISRMLDGRTLPNDVAGRRGAVNLEIVRVLVARNRGRGLR
jgi:hypothetical protein